MTVRQSGDFLTRVDFRELIEKSFDPACPFCLYYRTGLTPVENALAFVKPDARPVTEGHSLIIPKRHTRDWFGATPEERDAMNELLLVRRKQLIDADPTIEGFNMGMNVGRIAGQTVFHCHFHLIPRRRGDGGRMKGGVRHGIRDEMGRGG